MPPRPQSLLLIFLALCSLGPTWPADDPFADRVATLVKANEIAKAFTEAQNWTHEQPDNREALIACGDLAIRCGAYEEAIECYEPALFFAEEPALAVKLGDALRETNQDDAALASYRQALALDEACAQAHVGIGRLLMADAKQVFEARASINTAIAIDPQDTDAPFALAELEVAAENWNLAQEMLEDVVRDAPDAASPRVLLGKVLARLGEIQAARRHWREAVRLEPARPETFLLKSDLLPISQESLGVRGYYFSYSPDGERIAYIGAGATARQQVLLISVDAPQEPTVLAHMDDGTLRSVSWSPDGTRLAYLALRKKTTNGKTAWEYFVRTIGADGGKPRLVYTGRYAGVPVWMPDGKSLCFDAYATVPRRKRALHVAKDAENATLTLLLDGPKNYYVQWTNWAHSGERLITAGATYGAQRAWNLIGFEADKLDQPMILRSTPEPVYYPAFTPDGENIIFLERNARRTYGLYAISRHGASNRPSLMMRSVYAYPPSLRPDGARLLVYARTGMTVVTLAGL